MLASAIDGVLDITLHHANDIHNICIYGKQDVYAKFSITQAQDTVYSTQPVRGGGKNPVFNQSLQILISKLDAVLKCELWMMSCARSYLEDQLLGFVLVPLGELLFVGRTTRDYALSSTDLFHTHAGTVCLSLMFYQRGAELTRMEREETANGMTLDNGNHGMVKGPHINNVDYGVVESGDHGMCESANNRGTVVAPADYAHIEFPDLQLASENQQLVSMYLGLTLEDMKMERGLRGGEDLGANGDMSKAVQRDVCARESVLQLNSSLPPMEEEPKEEDCGMVSRNCDVHDDGCNGSFVCGSGTAGLSLSTGTMDFSQAASDHEVSDLNSSKRNVDGQTTCPHSSCSGGGLSASEEKRMTSSDGQESSSSFTGAPPLVSISLDAEEPIVQQHIMDMYMKSMQQFTESLTNMKLPFDLDISRSSDVEHKAESQSLSEEKAAPSDLLVKDGHRVFYGSRAFF